MSYVNYESEKAKEIAKSQARGCYQRSLLEGNSRPSGGDLQGKARKYAARYAESRENLLNRLEENGLEVKIWYDCSDHGKKKWFISIG